MVGSYEPCEKCLKKWAMGFVLIEAKEKPVVEGQPPMQVGAYPTGNYMVLSDDAAWRLLGQEHAQKGLAFIEPEAFRKLSESASKGGSEEL